MSRSSHRPMNQDRRQFLATAAAAIAEFGWRREFAMLDSTTSLQQGPLSAPVHSRVGREVRRQGASGDRRAFARVRL
jgi:hypothetical protein